MSHFTTIKVKIKERDILKQVLEDLGYTIETNVSVRGYEGDTVQADLVIRQTNGYDIGFRWQGESYEMVADFWGTGTQDELIQKITQKYAYLKLLASAQKQGFNVEDEKILDDGTLRVVVGQWV